MHGRGFKPVRGKPRLDRIEKLTVRKEELK